MDCEILKLSYLAAFIIHRRSSGIRMTPDEKIRFVSCLFQYFNQVLSQHYYISQESNRKILNKLNISILI